MGVRAQVLRAARRMRPQARRARAPVGLGLRRRRVERLGEHRHLALGGRPAPRAPPAARHPPWRRGPRRSDGRRRHRPRRRCPRSRRAGRSAAAAPVGPPDRSSPSSSCRWRCGPSARAARRAGTRSPRSCSSSGSVAPFNRLLENVSPLRREALAIERRIVDRTRADAVLGERRLVARRRRSSGRSRGRGTTCPASQRASALMPGRNRCATKSAVWRSRSPSAAKAGCTSKPSRPPGQGVSGPASAGLP